ncbi:MAG: hypothetical protein IT200_07155 [Thermoleophilia bacterium]|nr:hypothetical protein [Thermoleophilia bacterium]
MPRALRVLLVSLIALALVAATASAASRARQPRLQDLQAQQFQAQGNGTVSLDGGFSAIGWITASRRTVIRLVDRAGDAKLMLNGRDVPLRRRQVKLTGAGGRYLVTGTRYTLEVRGVQGLEASGVGYVRFQGRGQYNIAGGNSGVWNALRILIGSSPNGGGGNGGGDSQRRRAGALAAPDATPVAAPSGVAE